MISIFFSPRGTTKKTARTILEAAGPVGERDLLSHPLIEELAVPVEEPVLVAMPVYAGRIPKSCREQLAACLKGAGGPAIAVAVYGNRDYDDALTELQDLLEDKGFHVVAAGACPAGAIPKETPWVTRDDRCISCGACIHLCPTQTRQYRGEAYEAAAKGFEAKCARRREPEVFF